jgi:signal transduction histidine kinase
MLSMVSAALAAIFKPFAQAGVDRDKEKRGSRLTLAIVKHLMETMGGTVTSVPGKDWVFHLRFLNVPISMRLPTSGKPSLNGEVDFNEPRPATLLAVEEVLDNLLLHAIKFSPVGRRVFAPFRLIEGHTGGASFTGVGLSLDRKLMRAVDAELSCESSPRQRASFTIRLKQPAST